MPELSNNAQTVLQSLHAAPALNTPALIAGGDVAAALDQDEVKAALDELIAAGLVKHRATGWKLSRAA